ncbi:MAG: MerR family transcriptional regulator [Desulfobacterales bacterium]|jgi:DNA-binding transcriptional MerR regulator|nr:MerR family transcriptional regulator [Desulfobacterales bacterium]
MENPTPEGTQIPDKLYFKIGEVTDITGLESYVLRFWESEFPAIAPKRTESGQRLYRKSDVESILLIKNLLYVKKFTIEGAKKFLKDAGKQKKSPPPPADIEEIRSELLHIRNLLEDH